jgi:hypothetical protein
MVSQAPPPAIAAQPTTRTHPHSRPPLPQPPPTPSTRSMASRPGPQAPQRRGPEAARQHPGLARTRQELEDDPHESGRTPGARRGGRGSRSRSWSGTCGTRPCRDGPVRGMNYFTTYSTNFRLRTPGRVDFSREGLPGFTSHCDTGEVSVPDIGGAVGVHESLDPGQPENWPRRYPSNPLPGADHPPARDPPLTCGMRSGHGARGREGVEADAREVNKQLRSPSGGRSSRGHAICWRVMLPSVKVTWPSPVTFRLTI